MLWKEDIISISYSNQDVKSLGMGGDMVHKNKRMREQFTKQKKERTIHKTKENPRQ